MLGVCSMHRWLRMPPRLVRCGGAEVLAGESKTFAALASVAGWNDATPETWNETPHAFQVFDSVAPEGGEVITSVGEFIERLTSEGPIA